MIVANLCSHRNDNDVDCTWDLFKYLTNLETVFSMLPLVSEKLQIFTNDICPPMPAIFIVKSRLHSLVNLFTVTKQTIDNDDVLALEKQF